MWSLPASDHVTEHCCKHRAGNRTKQSAVEWPEEMEKVGRMETEVAVLVRGSAPQWGAPVSDGEFHGERVSASRQDLHWKLSGGLEGKTVTAQRKSPQDESDTAGLVQR